MIAMVMAIGAGVLVSSVAFELRVEAYEAGGTWWDSWPRSTS
jgi:hypothetical protein